ncbi:uncharacterized protein LOC111327256 isoform X2 [Stylophora pistillata]|uniref:uncharacterized protein LOC111327256 isoform X2 n=1 Tax=Stylophora pistillata TaxID=50429 RepID=UPI000C046AAD|nr:uncharacterized protein LOC111327256 isoform X2 [Stylophora pistillata]
MPSSKTKKRSNRIVINVGGVRHETFLSTLKTIPDTRLSYLGEHHTTVARTPEYDTVKEEYFFDRHPGVFTQILNFYRTGKLHCPSDVCGPLFEEELSFWGIDEQQVETCCWENYKQHKEKQEKLKYFKLPGYEEDPEERFLSEDSGLFEDVDEVKSWWSRYQPKIWKSLEEPYTSSWAKLVGIVSFVAFTAYIIKFSLSTLEYFSDKTASQYIALSVTHLVCISWFTMDFALRVLFSPNKLAFVKSPYTWTDLIPLVLLYVFFFHPSMEEIPFLEMLVMLKAARIFQLFKLSYVLQVLVNTLKASSLELCLLLVITGFVMVVFASIVYYLERYDFDSDFRSVPESMWWAVITMTTVGYGEVHPRTGTGKIVGSACAIFGVLVIALPVSVVASNFSLFYTYAKARLNLPPKKRRIAFSHALTSMSNQRSQEGPENSTHANFTSLCSERQTERSFPSEISISCSVTPRGSLKKSSFWSLRSMSKLLRPKRRSNVSRSKSLNSVLSDYKSMKEAPAEGITLKFEPPSRVPSVADIARDQPEGENTLLHVPAEERRKHSMRDSLREISRPSALINKSLYPLHLRRGAVSPASFSLKSASTASSLNALPRGYNELYNALSGKGPIILLSDQASVQSLCSIHSRMTCSCSSLRSAGSDGTIPDVIGENRTRTGSDGNFPLSPTEKADGIQVTLTVPVESRGKRRDNTESRDSVKEADYNPLALKEHSVNEADYNPLALKEHSVNEADYNPLALKEHSVNEADYNPLALKEHRKCRKHDHKNKSDEDEFVPVEFMTIPNEEPTSYDGNLGIICQKNTVESQNMDQINLKWQHNQQQTSPAKPIVEERSRPNKDNLSREDGQGDDNMPIEKVIQDTKSPIKPVPVIGRAVSAFSIMEYNIGKNIPSCNEGSQPVEDNTTRNDIERKTPKRRHSAFTPCHDNTTPRGGHLSTSFMKNHVNEREPLINGNIMRAYDSIKEKELGDNDNSQTIDDKDIQNPKRMRKSGVSSCYFETKSEIHKSIPSLEESLNMTSKSFADECSNQERTFQSLQPFSSDTESTDSECRPLPIANAEHEHDKIRTSRV